VRPTPHRLFEEDSTMNIEKIGGRKITNLNFDARGSGVTKFLGGSVETAGLIFEDKNSGVRFRVFLTREEFKEYKRLFGF
jgi:hypothetical protein